MSWVDGLTVVWNGNVWIKDDRSFYFFHYFPIFFKHVVFFFFLSLLHILWHNFQASHLLFSYFLLKSLFFNAKLLQIHLYFLDLYFFSLRIKFFLLLFLNNFFLNLSFGFVSNFLKILDFQSLTIDFRWKFFDCLHFNFGTIDLIFLWWLLFNAFKFTTTLFTVKYIQNSIVAVLCFKRTEYLAHECQCLV